MGQFSGRVTMGWCIEQGADRRSSVLALDRILRLCTLFHRVVRAIHRKISFEDTQRGSHDLTLFQGISLVVG